MISADIKQVAACTYAGDVEIKVLHDGVVINTVKQHNAGTAQFFELLLNCVIGKPVIAGRPGYLFLFNGESQISSVGTIYSSVTNPTIASDNEAYVTYTFLVPEAILYGASYITKFTLNSIMADGATNVEYASVTLDSPVSLGDGGNSLEVKLKLSIKNI